MPLRVNASPPEAGAAIRTLEMEPAVAYNGRLVQTGY
jgi:hypothetical protein